MNDKRTENLIQKNRMIIFRTVLFSVSLFALIAGNIFLFGDETKKNVKKNNPPFLSTGTVWADSLMRSMSQDEKIAQLFMVAAYSNKDKKHEEDVRRLIKEYKVGGLIMMQGGIVKHSKLLNNYQSISKIPLLISMDAEWGPAMRLDSVSDFPRQMALGAIQDGELIFQFGEEVARQCKLLGIHVNFAPVIDINNNPKNPVINHRSFGEAKWNVLSKGLIYMNALQKNNIIAVGKHFPGHGDTDVDSHKALPVINKTRKSLDSLEFFPFKHTIASGISGIMVAHLFIPSLDSTPLLAATLSKKIVTDLLKDSMQFNGLVFTDALNMKGVSLDYKQDELALKALQAGNDVILFPDDVPGAITLIKNAIKNNKISQIEIDKRCKKILQAKYWAGLSKYSPIKTEKLYEELNISKTMLLKRKLIENSLTLVKNDKGLVPFYRLDTLNIAAVAISNDDKNIFQETLKLYSDVKCFTVSGSADDAKYSALIDSLGNFNTIILSIHNMNTSPVKQFGLTTQALSFIKNISAKNNVVLSLMGNPYALEYISGTEKMESILVAYDDADITRELSAQLLFGGIPAKGKLPVSVPEKFKAGVGLILPLKIRLKYSIPEEVKANKNILLKIDSLAQNAIDEGAFPGCQILAVKNGVVFYHKAFGHHTYEKNKKVNIFDIYDIASITKVVATTPAAMKLYGESKLDLDKKVCSYLSYLDSTNKNEIIIKDILTHQGNLTPFIPFWKKTLDKNKEFKKEIYSKVPTCNYPYQVTDSLFIHKSYRDTLFCRMAESKPPKKKGYVYSDLSMYFMQDIIEKLTKIRLDSFALKNLYIPIGAHTMGYNPLTRFSKNIIPPTEKDTAFRKQLIHGFVHDQGAAMMGGVAGHAGVFSNANDIAKIFQMYLNKGTYGGRQFLTKDALEIFIKAPFISKGNRRGLGFDKPETNKRKPNPVYSCVSKNAFGHSGFTGTVVWADPDNNLIFVFLSNRIHPDAENKKIGKLSVRAKIQALFYDALKK